MHAQKRTLIDPRELCPHNQIMIINCSVAYVNSPGSEFEGDHWCSLFRVRSCCEQYCHGSVLRKASRGINLLSPLSGWGGGCAKLPPSCCYFYLLLSLCCLSCSCDWQHLQRHCVSWRKCACARSSGLWCVALVCGLVRFCFAFTIYVSVLSPPFLPLVGLETYCACVYVCTWVLISCCVLRSLVPLVHLICKVSL